MSSKVRVHELAKEYGLENKEVIAKLQAAGMAVKTHSSSVFTDEAKKVLGGSPGGTGEGATAAPKRRRGGMRIVKKSGGELQAKKSDDEKSSGEEAAPAVAVTQAEAPAQEERAPATAAGEAPVRAATEASTETATEAEAATATATPATAVAAEGQTDSPAAAGASAEAAPGKKSKVVRMIDRSKLLERVPSNRLGQEGRGGPGRNYGQVKELKVVNDPFGRGRSMVDVGARGKGKGVRRGPQRPAFGGARRGRHGMRERTSFPSRLRRRKTGPRRTTPLPPTRAKESKRIVRMDEEILVSDLAHQLQMKGADVVRILVRLGLMMRVNDNVDFDTAQLVADEFGFTVQSTAFDESEFIDDLDYEGEEIPEGWEIRPPVVTVMGHVDHGKTSLLDTIRKARVTAGEAGGITQHIGAYSVPLEERGSVTFLDTPGHAAFSAMRARGANVTDIVVLVVAADDGVMPQTREAIEHAKAAGVPIVVAVNKIDRPEANADRVTQELAQFDLVPEAWGGETLYVHTSATEGTGIEDLLDALVLQAEVLELVADPESKASGVAVEAKLDKGRGPVATILVRNGTLRRGDNIVIGAVSGRIRAMTDHTGKNVKEAGPSDAVEIIGLNGVPRAGDSFNEVEDLEGAKKVAEHRTEQGRDTSAKKRSAIALMKKLSGNIETLPIIVKADVQGSLEALVYSIEQLPSDEVDVDIIQQGVGSISESDIQLAAAGGAKVMGFNVKPDSKSRQLAQREGVAVTSHKVIYELLDTLKGMMEELLSPETKETVVGRAEVREVFRIAKQGMIAGSRVVSGKAMRGALARVLRGGESVYEGKVDSLKHYKEDVRQVESGLECGIGLDGFGDSKQGDIIEFYQLEEVKRTLDVARV